MKISKIVHHAWYVSFFIPQQISFLNRWFPDVEQLFYIYGAPREYLEQAPENVRVLNGLDMPDFIREARSADRVVFNGLNHNSIPVLFARFPEIVKKGVWIVWGGDLYWGQYQAKSIQRDVEAGFRRQFIRWLHGIATMVQGDYELARAWYGTRAKYIESAPNVFRFEQADLDRVITSRRPKNYVAIQLGNSGNPSNEHLEMLNWMMPHKEKNFKLFVPLSYGDQNHVEKVIQQGRAMFGDRFIPLTNLMSSSDYNRHLAEMDVLILNHRRPQGFGNTAISLYFGTKVFLRSHVSTWDYFLNTHACRIYDSIKIPEISFDDFTYMGRRTMEENRKRISILFDRDWQRSMWERLHTE